MEDNIIEMENETYDRDRERAMDEDYRDWQVVIKGEIEQLEFAIDSDTHDIETAIARRSRNEGLLEHKKKLLESDNKF